MLVMLELIQISVATLIGLSAAFIGFAYFAARDSIRFCFLKARENSFYAIMLNERFGWFVGELKDHHLNDPRQTWYDPTEAAWAVLPNKGREFPVYQSPFLRFLKHYGIYYYGLTPLGVKYHTYPFNWDFIDPDGKTEHRSEQSDRDIASRYTYHLTLREVSIGGNVKVKVTLTVTVVTKNPYIALFVIQSGWLPQLRSKIEEKFKEIAGTQTFEVLRAGFTEGDLGVNLADKCFELNISTGQEKGLPESIGKEIVDITFMTLEPDGTAEEVARFNQMLTAQFVAEREGAAKITTAEAYKTETKLKTDADTDRINRIGAAEAGAVNARLEAVTKDEKRVEAYRYEQMAKAGAAGSLVIVDGKFDGSGNIVGNAVLASGLKNNERPTKPTSTNDTQGG